MLEIISRFFSVRPPRLEPAQINELQETRGSRQWLSDLQTLASDLQSDPVSTAHQLVRCNQLPQLFALLAENTDPEVATLRTALCHPALDSFWQQILCQRSFYGQRHLKYFYKHHQLQHIAHQTQPIIVSRHPLDIVAGLELMHNNVKIAKMLDYLGEAIVHALKGLKELKSKSLVRALEHVGNAYSEYQHAKLEAIITKARQETVTTQFIETAIRDCEEIYHLHIPRLRRNLSALAENFADFRACDTLFADDRHRVHIAILREETLPVEYLQSLLDRAEQAQWVHWSVGFALAASTCDLLSHYYRSVALRDSSHAKLRVVGAQHHFANANTMTFLHPDEVRNPDPNALAHVFRLEAVARAHCATLLAPYCQDITFNALHGDDLRASSAYVYGTKSFAELKRHFARRLTKHSLQQAEHTGQSLALHYQGVETSNVQRLRL